MKAEIAQEADRMSNGAARGSKKWLSNYQRAAQFVRENLSDEELDILPETRECWEQEGIPEEVQAESVFPIEVNIADQYR